MVLAATRARAVKTMFLKDAARGLTVMTDMM